MRPTFDEVYLDVARTLARRATCDRASVGAVLVDDRNRIIGTGYNGSPAGAAHCTEAGHRMLDEHCVRTLHAEANALINAVVPTHGSTLYVTHYPCVRCANLIAQAGVRRVVIGQSYGDTTLATEVFEEAGIDYGVGEPTQSRGLIAEFRAGAGAGAEIPKPRYGEPPSHVDTYLGQYGRFDLYVDDSLTEAESVMFGARWGEGFITWAFIGSFYGPDDMSEAFNEAVRLWEVYK